MVGAAVMSMILDDPKETAVSQSSTQTSSETRDSARNEQKELRFNVCNKSGEQIRIAIAVREAAEDPFTVKGWWIVEHDDCSYMSRTPFGDFNNQHLYYHAKTGGGSYWDGNAATKFCIPNRRFERLVPDGYTYASDEDTAPFGEITVPRTQGEYTLTIR